MSWFQWVASWIIAFLIVVFLTTVTFYLLEKVKMSVREMIDYYLAKKKAIIAELEEQMEQAGKRKSVRSYDN